jgi:hypothetical protein
MAGNVQCLPGMSKNEIAAALATVQAQIDALPHTLSNFGSVRSIRMTPDAIELTCQRDRLYRQLQAAA